MTGWYPGKTLEIGRQVAGELLSLELLGHLRDGLNCNTATQDREAVGHPSAGTGEAPCPG